MTTARPLPPSIVQLMRGEINDNGVWAALAGLGRDAYRDGKAGRTLELVTIPGSVPRVMEAVNRFLLVCWDQGRTETAT